MATIETNPQLGAQIKADAKEFVLHSWSVQSTLDPTAPLRDVDRMAVC